MNMKKVISCPNCSKKMRVPKKKHIRFTCPGCNEALEFDDNTALLLQTTETNESDDSFGNDVIGFLSLFATIPLFIVLHKILPDVEWKFYMDRILLFIATIIVVMIMFESVRILLIVIFLVSYAYLIYGTIWGEYGFPELYADYANLLKSLQSFK